MSSYIKQTKDGSNYSDVVCAPIRKAPKTATIEEMLNAPITNIVSKFKSSSILSKLDIRNRDYGDIAGVSVKMICQIHDETFTDDVTVIGELGNFYIVEIDGTKYSVAKSCATFVKIED